jgi:hypothetical protein
MAYYGISSNLVLYLTTKLHQGVVPSANNVTNWVGTIWMTPIIGAYVADAHLGRYRTFMIASVIYLCVSRRRRRRRRLSSAFCLSQRHPFHLFASFLELDAGAFPSLCSLLCVVAVVFSLLLVIFKE